MHVHIVFAHPTHDSFTGCLLDAFTQGLAESGHTFTVSDLYAMRFNPLLDVNQYWRETNYDTAIPVPADVADEQAKLDAAEVWAFVYPVWWTDCPAILKGWFDRVWSVGYAYEPGHLKEEGPSASFAASQPVARQALVLCAAGHTDTELRATGLYQAMEAVMLRDRIADRAQIKRFIMFGGSADANPQDWPAVRQAQLDAARALGRDLSPKTD